ncbi:MAG: hypothetical protein A3F74_06975 [Betaproteobacteria bacterium RIFCSPLOWO2_12_FULL_62_58]|nr:MAG: hypothetical protein A3F74_06975 [Betaproteobacteria bacterium RIFCSPLOWO2_12_FULL_62_58]
MPMGLYRDFLTHTGRVVHKWTHYFPVYERYLAPWVNRSVTLIEIGCGEGGSLQLWKRYLGPYARIVGIDFNPACKAFEEDQISVHIGDQGDTGFLSRVIEEVGAPDIVIDDGSHIMHHMRASFDYLYPRLSKSGVYIIEDTHAAYWEEYGGGYRAPQSIVEYAKALVDRLNADHARGVVTPDDFTRSTHSVAFYESMIVFERGWFNAKHAPKIGRAP